MDCAICCNQQQINVAMVTVQVYFGRNCIEHFKGFNFMYSFPYQMWVPMSVFFFSVLKNLCRYMYFALGQKRSLIASIFDELV